jgi:hypothetical protein
MEDKEMKKFIEHCRIYIPQLYRHLQKNQNYKYWYSADYDRISIIMKNPNLKIDWQMTPLLRNKQFIFLTKNFKQYGERLIY